MPPAVCPSGGTAATREALLGPRDAELCHLLLQGGPLHSQSNRGPLWTTDYPVGIAEDADDVLPFGVGQRDRSARQYRVEHPRWKIWTADSFEFKADVATLYGEKFVDVLSAKPISAFIADGSFVSVFARSE